MLLVGLKDTKIAAFIEIIAVPTVDHYKNLVMQSMQKPDSNFLKNSQDYEIYTLGEIDGAGKPSGEPVFICQLKTIELEIKKSHLEWHKQKVEELSAYLGE